MSAACSSGFLDPDRSEPRAPPTTKTAEGGDQSVTVCVRGVPALNTLRPSRAALDSTCKQPVGALGCTSPH